MFSQERDNKSIWYLILISLSVVMSLQVIRVFVTCLVNAFGERYGQTLAAVPALIAFLAPFVAPLIVKLLGEEIDNIFPFVCYDAFVLFCNNCKKLHQRFENLFTHRLTCYII